ncbi:MAG: hypothetical protein O2887_18410 [Bacteroidetes bacterium]|nr:hypothetical protein [Bacteroidota bacterium]MDA1122428.1 hypothetical protein [Bacteroidota bacterium]
MHNPIQPLYKKHDRDGSSIIDKYSKNSIAKLGSSQKKNVNGLPLDLKRTGMSKNCFRSSRIPESILDYTPLPESLTLNKLHYTLIKRTNEVYMYGIAGEYTDSILHYEVGIISVGKPDKYSDKWREKPMSNGQFGKTYGKSFNAINKHRAEESYKKYVCDFESSKGL